LVTVPPALSGSSPQLLPTATPETQNEILGGLAVGAVYDDNIATTSGQRRGGFLYLVAPNFTLQQTRPSTTWDLNYAGGLTIAQDNPAVSDKTQDSTAVTGRLQHLFGRHTLLELRQDFLMTNNPFGQPGQTLSSVSGTGQLNSGAAVPVATRTSFVSTGSLIRQLSRHASVGISGSFSRLRFRDLPQISGSAVNLIDGRTITGRMFYAVDISPRQRIGAEYQAQDLRFGAGVARTVDQTVFLFDEIRMSATMTLTLFGGPDYAHVHNNILVGSSGSPSVLPVLHDVWSSSGGASFTWRGKHLALRLSGSSMVTDGGGATGAVRALTGSGELRRDFTRRWTASLGFTYSDGRVIEGTSTTSASTITTEQGTFAVIHKLSQRISMSGQYAHVQQLSHGVVIPYNSGNHNRASMSLMYQFAKPLGR